jgi:DNA-binding LytR/AlgR family response regulator
MPVFLKKLEEMLLVSQFIRTHKSYIVSVCKIRIRRAGKLVLADQKTIPVSVNYKDQVMKSFSG